MKTANQLRNDFADLMEQQTYSQSHEEPLSAWTPGLRRCTSNDQFLIWLLVILDERKPSGPKDSFRNQADFRWLQKKTWKWLQRASDKASGRKWTDQGFLDRYPPLKDMVLETVGPNRVDYKRESWDFPPSEVQMMAAMAGGLPLK